MPKYVFVVETTISLATVVDARSLQEAVAEAKSRGARLLSGDDHELWTTQLDGEEPVEGELVDFHMGNGETFDDAAAVWEME